MKFLQRKNFFFIAIENKSEPSIAVSWLYGQRVGPLG